MEFESPGSTGGSSCLDECVTALAVGLIRHFVRVETPWLLCVSLFPTGLRGRFAAPDLLIGALRWMRRGKQFITSKTQVTPFGGAVRRNRTDLPRNGTVGEYAGWSLDPVVPL